MLNTFSFVNLLKNIPKIVPTTTKNNIATSSLISKSNLISLANKPIQTQLLKQQNDNQINSLTQMIQKRFNWGYKGRMMLKDMKRREQLRTYAPVRIRLQALRANSILPEVVK